MRAAELVDVFALTSGVRAALGPVHVFNPQAIGGDPLDLPLVAGRRLTASSTQRLSAARTRSRRR